VIGAEEIGKYSLFWFIWKDWMQFFFFSKFSFSQYSFGSDTYYYFFKPDLVKENVFISFPLEISSSKDIWGNDLFVR
jgi:hypothetical protein